MTNREAILKTNIHDLMMEIGANTLSCPVKAVGGTAPVRNCDWWAGSCSKCITKWLNTECRRPTWQDAMMKNFLRKE